MHCILIQDIAETSSLDVSIGLANVNARTWCVLLTLHSHIAGKILVQSCLNAYEPEIYNQAVDIDKTDG